MALSQIQCLDDNHVNPRTHESKPEFLYCEEQRLALETLLCHGREAFFKQLEARGLRGFLSDLELEALAGNVEPFDPGVDLYHEDPEHEQTPLSLQYWPDLSDTSTPELDIGWPDSEAYRGVTRTTVHAQPPLDGHTHIKEVVRKMIAQAQKVIAVVMDVFTDVDIFRDLLDVSYKKKVSVYILLDHASVPHFLSMCHSYSDLRLTYYLIKGPNLRVRCCGGIEFHTHSCTKVIGHMGHRFMFIDGDKAVSGSYSFTWMSSRLDRNVITVVTGQAVDAFDRLFRFLYTTSSRLVDLQRVVTEPEPEHNPVPQPASVPTPSAAVARKLYNPKYALLTSTLVHPMGHQRKMSDGNFPIVDVASSPTSRKMPPRPPTPKTAPNQLYRQPPTSPTKPKSGQSPNSSPVSKPQTSFLYMHTQNMQQGRFSSSHQTREEAIPVEPGLEEEKTVFGSTFSKFYNFKGLKDKMSKLPTQSRRSSASGSAQPRKSTG
uniref:Scaffolding anchor of CK1 domain-containing protein n=1 Tax=Periophthalmus magnuspinnatus TaxID=409849 RepID=A0A3B3ZW24_9GOBI